MVDLNGHEAGNGGHSQGKPTAYRDSSTRRDAMFQQLSLRLDFPRGEELIPLAIQFLANRSGWVVWQLLVKWQCYLR